MYECENLRVCYLCISAYIFAIIQIVVNEIAIKKLAVTEWNNEKVFEILSRILQFPSKK